jgi:formate hydrogenlyase subunit 6/NADH:ubiquinone oxidoreductase subunit I
MFCELCVYPCPKDCIHMGTEFAFVTDDRSELNLDLLSFKGMAKEARVRMREAKVKKEAKDAAKAAKAAAAQKDPGESAADAAPEAPADEPEAETNGADDEGEA